jgi:hypothetical protein
MIKLNHYQTQTGGYADTDLFYSKENQRGATFQVTA